MTPGHHLNGPESILVKTFFVWFSITYFISRCTIIFSLKWTDRQAPLHRARSDEYLGPFWRAWRSDRNIKRELQSEGRVPYIITSQSKAQSHLHRYYSPAVQNLLYESWLLDITWEWSWVNSGDIDFLLFPSHISFQRGQSLCRKLR